MASNYDQKAQAKLSRTVSRVLRNARAKYGLSAAATVSACSTAMADLASDAGISDHQFGLAAYHRGQYQAGQQGFFRALHLNRGAMYVDILLIILALVVVVFSIWGYHTLR
jgi:hypothetical protein